MAERLVSLGLDVGTTSTQMIFSELTIENRAGSFSVPEMEIAERKILYKSPVHFTPLLTGELVDAAALRKIVDGEYARAGLCREDVDTGAIIITGETSRKENARSVLAELSGYAGDFVVAAAGPDLESVLAAKGAGAVSYSEQTGKTVLHMDIGGGTSNLSLIEDGKITATGCLNVGGRLIRYDETGIVTYVSPVLAGLCSLKPGHRTAPEGLEAVAEILVQALEMAAGLREPTPLLNRLTTEGTAFQPPEGDVVISFSGGVADCIDVSQTWNAYGDLGPILGQVIRRSRLCRGVYTLGSETIRATVIGAGSYATQLSGSTVFYQNVVFPMKNLPVVTELAALSRLDTPGVLALPGIPAAGYGQITALADRIAGHWPDKPVLIALQADMAKALGHALALRLRKDKPIVCIDRVHLTENSYLDIAPPVSSALPVVVKTLIFNR